MGSTALGKPGGVDLAMGLVTGPTLYAWEEYEAMGVLIGRRFQCAGDFEEVDTAISLGFLSP